MPLPKDSKVHNPQLLNKNEERILEAVRDLRFVTAPDIKHLLFPTGSLANVQVILGKLSGGKDYAEREFLYRFPMPSSSKGTKQRIYALGAKGREALAVEGYYRPYNARYLSYSYIWHHLSLVRFVCSAHVWCRQTPQVRLADIHLCDELARELATTETTGNDSTEETSQDASEETADTIEEPPAPVPDGWLNFELLANGVHTSYVPIWLEIDRGSMYRLRFQQHVEGRIEFIQSERYTRFFGAGALRIAYAAISEWPEYRQSRLSAMRAWTSELLTELKLTGLQNLFYFSSLDYGDIYNLTHFSESVWYTPADATPRRLLEQ